MTTYEYIRWKANNTRKSKIVKSKKDKDKDTEKQQKAADDSPSAAPMISEFMDSSKRL